MSVAMFAIWAIYFIKNIVAANMRGNIVGGQFSKIEQFPHSVFVYIQLNKYSTACGGSILNQAIIITAAHCLERCDNNSNIYIFAGNEEELRGSFRKVSEIKLHEEYKTNKFDHDIALMRLEKDLILGKKIGKVVLMQWPIYNKIAFVAGWGRHTEVVPGGSIYLKHISQRIYRREQCGDIGLNYATMPLGTFCGEHWRILGHPSYGDSGSALVVRHYIQVGLVSYAQLYISVTNTVYTDMGFYYQWVMENAKNLYCHDHEY